MKFVKKIFLFIFKYSVLFTLFLSLTACEEFGDFDVVSKEGAIVFSPPGRLKGQLFKVGSFIVEREGCNTETEGCLMWYIASFLPENGVIDSELQELTSLNFGEAVEGLNIIEAAKPLTDGNYSVTGEIEYPNIKDHKYSSVVALKFRISNGEVSD